MPHEVAKSLLQGQRTIIPFEEIGGAKQVSSIVVCAEGKYASYSFIDSDDKYLGPIALRKADVPSESIEAWLSTQEGQSETVLPARVDIIESSFFIDGKVEAVIEGIDIVGRDGRTLRMRREGAAYPYGLVLA